MGPGRRWQGLSVATSAAGGVDPGIRAVSVYVVDDHELLRRGLVAFLTEVGGFRVVGDSGSAREAMRRIAALRPDVMLLDVHLPDGSGIEICRHVRGIDPRIKALMLTSFDDEQARLAAMLAGASGFALKEVHSEALCEAIRRVAAGDVLRESALRAGTTVASGVATPRDPRLAGLTGQEQRVLALLGEGLSNRQIGERLTISEKTVKNYVSSILAKLGFQRRSQAAVFAVGRR